MGQELIVIEAGRSERHYWLDLWRYRELFRVLAWRDLSVRYKQTVIGVLWALLRRFFTIVHARLSCDIGSVSAPDGQAALKTAIAQFKISSGDR